MRIGILDDDAALASHVENILLEAGYRCVTFHSGRKLISALHHESFDVLILDWNVPDYSGMAILTWLRREANQLTPALLLTNRSSEEDIVEGLKAGADDYIVKPVRGPILLARLEGILRRAYPTPACGAVEQYDSYSFDTQSEIARFRGEDLGLTTKEFLLAITLFRNQQRALSRSHLLESVWGRNPDLPTRTLDAHVSKVRSKLNLAPENGYKIVPIYAYGYRLEKIMRESQ